MKVIKASSERDNAKLAMRLGFLREARGVTLQALADMNGTQRSNLSAFITSSGRVRNISYEKLDRILFTLGMLPDGTLSPGLHRWQVGNSMVPALCEILLENEFQRAVFMSLSTGADVFLVARVTANILAFGKLGAESLEDVLAGLSARAENVSSVTLDRAGDSSIQAMWMTDDLVRVEKLLLSLLQN